MNGNQGDRVTFVSTWRRSKQRLSFCRTFQPLIQHTDAAHSDRRTTKPRRHFLNRRVGIHALLGFEFAWANYVLKMSRMHACLQMYVPMHNTFKAPGQWKT